jgi:exopolyphosphatase/guanosine-5'-triphosphate,3'-diphosphate pyrophosphatase
MTTVAAVDCGTNTIRLLVADIDRETGTQDNLVREQRIVRLGQGVDSTGRLADEAMARVFAACEEYASIVGSHEVTALRFVATSAARDADNSHDFADGVRARLGVSPEVVSGDDEAALSYDGATRMMQGVEPPIAVVDIGGGSTEVIVGGAHEDVTAASSLDIGSVRITERLLASDPPTAAELEAATSAIDEALDTLPSCGVHVGDAHTLVGVAGTVSTLATLLLGLDHWDREQVHLSTYAFEDVHGLVERLVEMTAAERARLGVPEGRADVIGAGALILDRVLRRSSSGRLTVSDSDILDGIAWSIA